MSLQTLFHSPHLTESSPSVGNVYGTFDPDQTLTGTVNLNDNTISYTLYAGGPNSALTVHPAGVLGCKSSVDRLAVAGALLGDNTLVYDQPRHNVNAKDPLKVHTDTLKAVVDSVRNSQLLDRLGYCPDIEAPLLFTPHSMGYASAIRYGIERPGDVTSVVGIAPQGFDKWQILHTVEHLPRLHQEVSRIHASARDNPEIIGAFLRHVTNGPLSLLYELAYCARSTEAATQSQKLLEAGIPIGVIGFTMDQVIETSVLRMLIGRGIDYSEFPDADAVHNATIVKPREVAKFARQIHARLQGRTQLAA